MYLGNASITENFESHPSLAPAAVSRNLTTTLRDGGRPYPAFLAKALPDTLVDRPLRFRLSNWHARQGSRGYSRTLGPVGPERGTAAAPWMHCHAQRHSRAAILSRPEPRIPLFRVGRLSWRIAGVAARAGTRRRMPPAAALSIPLVASSAASHGVSGAGHFKRNRRKSARSFDMSARATLRDAPAGRARGGQRRGGRRSLTVRCRASRRRRFTPHRYGPVVPRRRLDFDLVID